MSRSNHPVKTPAFREPGAAEAGGYVLALACLLVAVGLVFHPPARKERSECELGKHHELRAARIGFLQHLDQARDHALSAVGEVVTTAGSRPIIVSP